MYSFKLNEGQHVCTSEGTMYDPYYIRLLGVYYVTRLRCIHHYYQQREGVEPIFILNIFLCQSKHDKSAS